MRWSACPDGRRRRSPPPLGGPKRTGRLPPGWPGADPRRRLARARAIRVSDSVTDLGGGWKVGAEDFLAAVLRATAQPIWVVDPGGLIRFANPAAITALGYERADELFGRDSREVRGDGSMLPASYVSVPIDMPGGRGAVVAFTDIEARLSAERSLREREAQLAEQQAALRRVAALVADDAPSQDVFASVAREVGTVLRLPLVQMSRYEADGTATVIGAWSERPHPFRAGTRWPLDDLTVSAQVRRTGRPARIDDVSGVPGEIAEAVRRIGIRSVAGAPIVVNGRVWGLMATGSADANGLAADTEQRLADFTELVATALSHTQARETCSGWPPNRRRCAVSPRSSRKGPRPARSS